MGATDADLAKQVVVETERVVVPGRVVVGERAGGGDVGQLVPARSVSAVALAGWASRVRPATVQPMTAPVRPKS